MKVIITRPQQCPHYKMGIHYALCLYPTNTAPLRCDTAVTARKDDGFPIDCPLRKEATRMTEPVDLALLRGAFQQLKAFCQSRPRPDGCVCDIHCPLVSVCGTYLEYDGLDEFADDMMEAIKHLQGFSAGEVV